MSNNSLAAGKAELAKGEAKLKKLVASVKKIFAKGFLVVLLILISAIPVALIITYIIQTYCSAKIIEAISKLSDGRPLFIYSYALSVAGIYFTRIVAGAIKTLSSKQKNS